MTVDQGRPGEPGQPDQPDQHGPSEPARHVAVPDRVRALKRRVPAPLKAAARRTVRGYGQLTSGFRSLPDFMIIGAKRGGTTSLWNYLVRHPEVLPLFPSLQQIKSPHYFDINYGRGLDWYRSHFPTRRRVAALRQAGGAALCGEASPYYMFHPLAAERAARTVPNVKAIVLLRNPVDRAYSHFNERRGSDDPVGHEPIAAFEEALRAEDGRLAGEVDRIIADPSYYSPGHDNGSYLARGRYLEHLRPWFDFFDREQLLVLLAEELYTDPGATFGRVCDFLGLRPHGLESYPRYNFLPTSSMDPGTRKILLDYFRPHNAELGEFLGRELPWNS